MNQKANLFAFTSYQFEPQNKRVLFNYKTEFEGKDPLFFTETIILPKAPDADLLPEGLVKKLLEDLHIALGISYYKLYCATDVAIPYVLSKREADFWNTLYKKGLGEFFYKNNLDPKNSPKFPHTKTKTTTNYSLPATNSRCLIGIGGGKDSIVSAELLKEGGFSATSFHVQTGRKSHIISNVISALDMPTLTMERMLDPKAYQPHQYNGHIPISAIYAFLGFLSAALYGYSYVVVSNEYSSNFGNMRYKGVEINHQWSKSFEFEKLFQEHAKEFLSPDIAYFSLLRSFYEIRIVKLFAKYKKYFPLFSSCNRNFSQKGIENGKLWCCQCAKCVFAFTLLSAFLSKKELVDVFGKNLYQDEALLPLFKDILGLGTIHPHTSLKNKFGITISKSEAALPVINNSTNLIEKIGVGVKPFDCVGTFEETQTALFLAKNTFKNDFIVKQLAKKVIFSKEVFSTNKESSIPEQFKFLGMKSTFIVRYGQEGKIAKQYLKKYYPKLKIGLQDEAPNKNDVKKSRSKSDRGSSIKYFSNILSGQTPYDIAIKTPGVNKNLIEIPYTTPTNIFFSHIKGNHMIIGVTGSKGKSTTSSLIFAILKEAKKDVTLLGNIGKPMLQALLHPIPKNRIFVLELSSFQLDDIKFSPDISVITSLFPEHMDFHGGIKNYYEAKKNIINFHNKDNYVVYNLENKVLKTWLKEYRGTAVPFAKSLPLKDSEIPLLGEHNKSNIQAAVTVAKLLKIPDSTIKNAIKKFRSLPHRLEYIGEYEGIKFYDDAISTTPESTIMAIKSLENIDTIFLGGEDRGYDFSHLEKTIKKYTIKNIVLFPDSGSKILKSKKGFNILETSNMKRAVAFAFKNTKKGGVCLLSCASPSYSLWKNFEEKGDQFQRFVKQLAR